MNDNAHSRLRALELAVATPGITNPADVVALATGYFAFIEAGTPPAAAETPAPKPARTKKEKPADPPPQPPQPAAAPETPASAGTTPAAPAADDDIFGETPAPAAPAAKKYDANDVRTALVAVQSKDGNKDRALAILKKFAPAGTLAGLKEEDFAKVIAEAHAAIK